MGPSGGVWRVQGYPRVEGVVLILEKGEAQPGRLTALGHTEPTGEAPALNTELSFLDPISG